MTRCVAASLVVTALLSVAPAAAADRETDGTTAAPALPAWAVERPAHRPVLLPALYASYAALQGADLLTTMQAVKSGAREVNPLMQPAGNLTVMFAIKGASAAGAIYLSERMWKKNRVGAIILMATLNGVSAAVVAHNTRTGRR